MNERKNLVYVYGTLLRNHGNWQWALKDRSEYLGKHITEPEYTMLHLGGFPGVIDRGETAIHGEVFSVDDKVFKDLDRLEGYPHLYTRKEIDTEYGKSWVYLINDVDGRESRCPIIEDGIWR